MVGSAIGGPTILALTHGITMVGEPAVLAAVGGPTLLSLNMATTMTGPPVVASTAVGGPTTVIGHGNSAVVIRQWDFSNGTPATLIQQM